MLKNKIKLSLIDDYVKLVIFNNFLNSELSFESCEDKINFILDTNKKLKTTYEDIFEQLKLNDSSLILLKQQLKQNNNLYEQNKNSGFNEINLIINKIIKKQNDILANLKFKLEKLKISVNINSMILVY